MFLAINGSARRQGNTAILLENALDGIRFCGKETCFINLYDLNFHGCVSCFACKVKGGKPFCAHRDGLTPLLDLLENCEGALFGSPIYFMGMSGAMHSFLERFIFSHMLYNSENCWRYPQKIPFAMIYTWGADEGAAKTESSALKFMEGKLADMLGTQPEILHSYESWQFDDYSRFEADVFDPVTRWERRQTIFPQECRQAREIGIRLSENL